MAFVRCPQGVHALDAWQGRLHFLPRRPHRRATPDYPWLRAILGPVRTAHGLKPPSWGRLSRASVCNAPARWSCVCVWCARAAVSRCRALFAVRRVCGARGVRGACARGVCGALCRVCVGCTRQAPTGPCLPFIFQGSGAAGRGESTRQGALLHSPLLNDIFARLPAHVTGVPTAALSLASHISWLECFC